MATHYCNTCELIKPVEEFIKYGSVYKPCKEELKEKHRSLLYTNRQRCKCGLYTPDGNPKV